MAKKAKTAIKGKDAKVDVNAKNFTKVIRTVRSPKTGSYAFKEHIMHKESVKDYLSSK